ncbi:hypothetical protein F0L68_33340 [Solihabitans fulvus]|uniref:Uncharacterized protein n=1 Tax=Solihabitans fulvus TaxID=1892852 RepID=A0A5B2WTU3_9PSEU|nr:hypothetical protein [Solihabitans fulvus]KAA2253297.1 hypothetical protein F0L68_33340 [Solihabitans fulvus]
MTHHVPETVVRRFTDNSCAVTTVVADPADAQQVLYGTVTRDGVLVGSYYCADRVRQTDWRIVTADGDHLTLDDRPVNPVSEPAAVLVLTTVLTGHDQREIQQQLRDATRPPP